MYPQFPPAALLSPRGHHPAAYYPQPILYWGYPSPPVSPTAYYTPNGHLSHNGLASPQPGMVRESADSLLNYH